MTLSSHEVNVRRGAAKPAVNSVWFWGEGARPAKLPARYGVIYADDAFSLGIARLSDVEGRATPARVDILSHGGDGGAVLLVITSLARALSRGDEAAWITTAQMLDQKLFAEMGAAIARFGTVRIVLPTQTNTRVATLGSGSRWRIFRSRKPIAGYA
jgi:hypothetical protein